MLPLVISDNLSAIKALCEKHKVNQLFVFGSAVSGNFTDKSDVDLLYKFNTSAVADYFINFFELKENLEKLLKRPVDMVPYENLQNKYFIESVEKSKIVLYEC
jgi:uncharacterized protein